MLGRNESCPPVPQGAGPPDRASAPGRRRWIWRILFGLAVVSLVLRGGTWIFREYIVLPKVQGVAQILSHEYALPSNGQRYSNSEHGFSIIFPAEWEVKPSVVENTIIKAVHREAGDRIAMITIAAYSCADDETLNEIPDNELARLAGVDGTLPAKVVQVGKGVMSRKQARWVEHEIRGHALADSYGVSWFIQSNKRIWRLSMFGGDSETFEKLRGLLTASLRTFELR